MPADKGPENVRLRLFVLSDSVPSEDAVANLCAIADKYLIGRYELEVVDVRNEPLRALREGALMIPTLLLVTEKGDRRIVGDLSDAKTVLKALGLVPEETKDKSP